MTNPGKYQGNTADIQAAATNAYHGHQELENHLGALFNVSDELAVVLKSEGAGNAANMALADALQKGKALDATLVRIVEQTKIQGYTVDEADLEARGRISEAALGGSGGVEAPAAASKISPL
ncbi:hypothetical protein [Nocardia jejuensis]|uniref:hypothetical protein n=1 Tax=Nocardia jejuensis TaxID=328049 RepID=UPI00082DACE0|nr:hypothetical protein [Nocardia jejuensis]